VTKVEEGKLKFIFFMISRIFCSDFKLGKTCVWLDSNGLY